MSNPSITADKTPWYQWDTGLTVTVSGGAMNECHFANRKQGTAYVQAVINGVARVPDELLQVAAPIKAYGYVSDGAGGQTYIEETFEVIARNIPADYTYTKTAQKTIRDAEAARDEAVQAAKDAKASELAADDSAVEASKSAQSAGESASASATSASNAAKSAGDAAKSASDAKTAADNAVEDASDLLKTYTDNAKTSADNAATSASNAADAASVASDSASAAEQSANDANSAKVAAQTAKSEAETSKSEAAASATNAAESATAAAKSASDAAASVDAINVISPKTIAEGATAPSLSFSAGYCATCTANANYSVAIGNMAEVSEIGSIAIGSAAISTMPGAAALGDNAKVNHRNSAAIGSHSETTKENEFSIGSADYSGGEYTREITHVSTPSADTSASTKKYTDDNDTKTLSEAKKYADTNTSNALVGTVSGKLLHVEDAWPGKPLGLTIDGAYKQDGTPSPESPVPITVIENPVLKITGADTSADGTSLPITLPSEHPYLAALPNGTHDEIVIDKDGNASLIARVKATTTDDINKAHNYEEKADGNDFQIYLGDKFKYGVGLAMSNVCVDGNVDDNNAVKGGVIKGGYIRMTKPEKVTDIASAKAYLIEIGFMAYIAINTPVTYPLGKVTVPSLPDSISNVCTDAELTTNMSMTYKRDINIAFDNLVQAVVAAAAGE